MTQDDLARYLAGGLSTDKMHPLDKFTHKLIMNVLYQIVIPWFVTVITKYPEAYFHQKMADPSWDFIVDWKTNHADKYGKMIHYARKLRRRFHFDTQEVLNRVVGALNEEAGWIIYPEETMQLYDVIDRVRAEIYV